MSDFIDVRETGAVGDGIADDGAAFQSALDSGRGRVVIPAGNYKIGRTLYIGSNTEIVAEPGAVIRLADNTSKKRGDFLLTNRSHGGGLDEHIAVRGGTWDGNNLTNRKPEVLFDDSACSGAIMSFKNVADLTLSGLTLKDSGGYFTRFCRVNGFLIEDISFISTEYAPNNDGLHFNGFVENGVIRNIRALTPRTTSDDLVALNADDIVTRCEALDMECGYIRNLTFDGIYAEGCASFFRMLSIDSDITNIKITNVVGGFTCLVVNMDASRNCMTPMVDTASERSKRGVGCVENVSLEHLRVHSLSRDGYFPYFALESNMKNFSIRDLVREVDKERTPHAAKTVLMCNVRPSHVRIEGMTGPDGFLADGEKVPAADDGAVDTVTEYYREYLVPDGGFNSFEVE